MSAEKFRVEIDAEKCIKCRRCISVCPSAIFIQDTTEKDIELRNISHCIFCGHCVAVCPTGAITHSSFPPEKIHAIDTQELPSPESVLLLCKKRRSNRAFKGDPVPQEKLQMILDAAHSAPTASNRQEVYYALVTDPHKLQMITDYTIKSFASIIRLLKNPILKPFLKRKMPQNYKMLRRMERLTKEYNKGNDPILRNAKVLILIYTPKNNRFGRDDANLAYQNGSLMAESLGVAQFYTGYLCTALRRDKKRRLVQKLGIEGEIHAGMALGMPAFTFPNYIERKDISVIPLRGHSLPLRGHSPNGIN